MVSVHASIHFMYTPGWKGLVQKNGLPIEKYVDTLFPSREKTVDTQFPHSAKRSIVAIPCYNEEKTIGSTVLKAKQYADEVVVIDDGCTDDTAKIAQIAGAVVVRHGGNKGYGAAIQSCFTYAREHDVDVMTILDGDGQHDADLDPEIMVLTQPRSLRC